jgi:hypothetical protein
LWVEKQGKKAWERRRTVSPDVVVAAYSTNF